MASDYSKKFQILRVNITAVTLLYFFKEFIYLFLERGEGREKERERNINVWLPLVCCSLLGTWSATQACALTGNGTSDPLVRRPELNPLSHAVRAHCCIF